MIPGADSQKLVIGTEFVAGLIEHTTEGASVSFDKHLGSTFARDYDQTSGFSLNKPAQIPEHYRDSHIYGRYWLTPTNLSAGFIMASFDSEVRVWNATAVSADITGVQSSDTSSGTALTVKAYPLTLPPYGEEVYTLSIYQNGPPILNVSYEFTVNGTLLTISIEGIRVVIFPWSPQRPLVERLEWKTNILVAYDGTEQRMMLRSMPRQSFEMNVLAGNDLERSRQMTALFNWHGKLWGVPVWTEARTIDQAVSANDMAVVVDTANGDFRTGYSVLLWASAEYYEAVDVQDILGDRFSLAKPVARGFPTGSLAIPLRLGHTQKALDIGSFPINASQLKVTFHIEDNVELTAEAPSFVYKTKEVVVDRPVIFGQTMDGSISRPIEYIDNGAGPVAIDIKNDCASFGHEIGWHVKDSLNIWNFRKWLHGKKGKLESFWVPTFGKDVEIVGTVASTQPYIDIKNIGYTKFIAGHPNKKHLAFFKATGEIFFREITGWTEASGTMESLTLDTPLGFDCSDVDFFNISFMGLYRFDTDIVELAWQNGRQAKITVPVKSLNKEGLA